MAREVHFSQTMTCPHCFTLATGDFTLDPETDKQHPGVGDAFLCSFCNEPSIFAPDLELRMPTGEELEELRARPGYEQAKSLMTKRRGSQ